MGREIATVIELQQLPARAILEDGCGDLWVESAGIFVRLRDNLERTANDLVECFAPLTLVHPLECDPDPILVEDLSTLRPGDVIEVHRGDVVIRGPIDRFSTASDGQILGISSGWGFLLWSSAHSMYHKVYLVSRPKPPLPTHLGAILTRAVVRGKETRGPIILDSAGDWRTPRPVTGYWYHQEHHVTDWTIGRLVEADAETGQ